MLHVALSELPLGELPLGELPVGELPVGELRWDELRWRMKIRTCKLEMLLYCMYFTSRYVERVMHSSDNVYMSVVYSVHPFVRS